MPREEVEDATSEEGPPPPAALPTPWLLLVANVSIKGKAWPYDESVTTTREIKNTRLNVGWGDIFQTDEDSLTAFHIFFVLSGHLVDERFTIGKSGGSAEGGIF